jgi:hypothetical protein
LKFSKMAISAVADSKRHASPAAPPTDSEFLTNLLQAVLSSSGSLPCPLPADFCAALLRDDGDGRAAAAGEFPF